MSVKTIIDEYEFFTSKQKKLISWSIVTMIFVAALSVIGKFLVACLSYISSVINTIYC